MDRLEMLARIYVFLYQNLNIEDGAHILCISIIYVFLYQNLNTKVLQMFKLKNSNLCISILEFKLLKNSISLASAG